MNIGIEPKRIEFVEFSRLLGDYERKHKVSTIEFFRRFSSGELDDDPEMLMWAGIFHLYLTSLPIRQFMQQGIAAAV